MKKHLGNRFIMSVFISKSIKVHHLQMLHNPRTRQYTRLCILCHIPSGIILTLRHCHTCILIPSSVSCRHTLHHIRRDIPSDMV